MKLLLAPLGFPEIYSHHDGRVTGTVNTGTYRVEMHHFSRYPEQGLITRVYRTAKTVTTLLSASYLADELLKDLIEITIVHDMGRGK